PDHDVGKVVLDQWNVAEEIACIDQRRDPRRPADHVEDDEFSVSHRSHACEKGSEGAHDRHEAADDDGEAPILLVEAMRTLEVLRLEPASEARVLRTGECFGYDKSSDAVVDGVSEDHSGE